MASKGLLLLLMAATLLTFCQGSFQTERDGELGAPEFSELNKHGEPKDQERDARELEMEDAEDPPAAEQEAYEAQPVEKRWPAQQCQPCDSCCPKCQSCSANSGNNNGNNGNIATGGGINNVANVGSGNRNSGTMHLNGHTIHFTNNWSKRRE